MEIFKNPLFFPESKDYRLPFFQKIEISKNVCFFEKAKTIVLLLQKNRDFQVSHIIDIKQLIGFNFWEKIRLLGKMLGT